MSSVQDSIYAFRKAHMHSTLSLGSFVNVTFEMIPVFIWLMMALSRPFKEDHLAPSLSMPLSSRWSMVWCPWLCAHRWCLKLLNTSDHPRSKPLVRVALPASPLYITHYQTASGKWVPGTSYGPGCLPYRQRFTKQRDRSSVSQGKVKYWTVVSTLSSATVGATAVFIIILALRTTWFQTRAVPCSAGNNALISKPGPGYLKSGKGCCTLFEIPCIIMQESCCIMVWLSWILEDNLASGTSGCATLYQEK